MFVKYATSDNAFGKLSSAVNTTQTTITLSSSQNLPTGTAVWIATLTQYANDGTVFKFEKVKVTNNVSGTLTVVRGFDGTTAETFNQDDYVFLNVVSEIIKDIQNAVDAMSSVFVGSGNNKVFGTDGSGNLVALSFGTTAGTVAEGNHTHSQYQLTSQKNAVNGYAGLDSNGQIDPGQLPVLATTETVVVADQTAMLALTSAQIQKGDIAVQSAGSTPGTRWLFGGGTISDINNWILLADTTPEWSVIAGKPTTVAGYGISDAYTKTEVTSFLSGKANTAGGNVFSGIQGISENILYVGGSGLSDTVGGNGKASIDVRNDTSGAIFRSRVNQSNNYVIDYFNGASWSNKMTLQSSGAMIIAESLGVGGSQDSKFHVLDNTAGASIRIGYAGSGVNYIDGTELNLRGANGFGMPKVVVGSQDRTSGWTSFTVVFNQTVTHSCVGYYKQIGKIVFFEVHGQITNKLSASGVAAITLPINGTTNHGEMPIIGFCLSAGQNPATQNKGQAVCYGGSAYFVIGRGTGALDYSSITNNDFWTMTGCYEAS